jgi:alpha/beta superfamily hydrolase
MALVRTRNLIKLVLILALFASACGRGGEPGNGGEGSDVAERDVTFETNDDVKLAGRLFGKGRVGVVMAHEYPVNDASGWYTPAREFARAGYMGLAFNFRGYGSSDGPKAIEKATSDVQAAMAELKERGARDVVLVGASMGGTASIIAAENQEPLAVVAISAPTTFMGLDAQLVSTRIQRPVMLMASRGDEQAFEALEVLERALPNPEETRIYEGNAHGTALLDDRPEAIEEIVKFLERYAPKKQPTTTAET